MPGRMPAGVPLEAWGKLGWLGVLGPFKPESQRGVGRGVASGEHQTNQRTTEGLGCPLQPRGRQN